MKKIYLASSIFLIVTIIGVVFFIRSGDQSPKKGTLSSKHSGSTTKTKKGISTVKDNKGPFNKRSGVQKSIDTYKKAKVVFKKPKKRFKRKKSLFPKGRIKNFPWRKGRPVITKNFKPPKGKLPGKYNFQNEINPNWETFLKEGLSERFEGQKIETEKKNSVVISNGDKAIFAEEVGVTVGDSESEMRMIVNSENGDIIHKFSDNGGSSGSGDFKEPISGGEAGSNTGSDVNVSKIWGDYSGFHYAKEGDLAVLEGKKEDEESISSRVKMTEEEKETYQNSLEK